MPYEKLKAYKNFIEEKVSYAKKKNAIRKIDSYPIKISFKKKKKKKKVWCPHLPHAFDEGAMGFPHEVLIPLHHLHLLVELRLLERLHLASFQVLFSSRSAALHSEQQVREKIVS